MTRFEYLLVTFEYDHTPKSTKEVWKVNGSVVRNISWDTLADYCNARGREGWELVSGSGAVSDAS